MVNKVWQSFGEISERAVILFNVLIEVKVIKNFYKLYNDIWVYNISVVTTILLLLRFFIWSKYSIVIEGMLLLILGLISCGIFAYFGLTNLIYKKVILILAYISDLNKFAYYLRVFYIDFGLEFRLEFRLERRLEFKYSFIGTVVCFVLVCLYRVLLLYAILYLLERVFVSALRIVICLILFFNQYIFVTYIIIFISSISMVFLKMHTGYVPKQGEVMEEIGSYYPSYQTLVMISYWLLRSEFSRRFNFTLQSYGEINKIWLRCVMKDFYGVKFEFKYIYPLGSLNWLGILVYLMYFIYILIYFLFKIIW
jgi:hypothetical protein